MAVDAMDVDSSPAPAAVSEPERKRKHKNKDQSSKKKRKHDSNLIADETTVHETTSKKSSKSKGKSKQKTSEDASSTSDSPYVLTTATLYLPLSPISISPTHALASLLAEHLSPLLLTYYPPLEGVILAYSNASISSEPPTASSSSSDPHDNPQPLTLAKTADEYGVLYVYLTATFLVFRPQRGQILEGWVNVQSEGFLGAVVLNLFSVGIERKRLPANWKWVPPGEEEEVGSNKGEKPKKKVFSSTEDDDDSEPSSHFDPEKEHFKPTSLASDANPFSETMELNNGSAEDDESAVEGYFQSVSGHRVRGTVRFRVVDIDVIPGSDRERGFLSIEGTMLSPEEEARVVEEERNGNYSSMTPRRPQGQWEPSSAMSGALAGSSSAATETQFSTADADADADAGALEESPSKKKERKTEKEKKSKSSKSKKKKEEK